MKGIVLSELMEDRCFGARMTALSITLGLFGYH
ncbi:hypothetical protein JOE21_003223 [Desmospora profundinema]|uniref:Uncharacterized protein n=1 Tax=Desmospora profundinema TaxID=1571184 RepID=A0ABU1IRZ7_9BACL|nr:hypothetical protein [Desmospora profundinema]